MKDYNTVSEKLFKVLFLEYCLYAVFISGIHLVIWFVVKDYEWAQKAVVPYTILVVLYGLYKIFIAPHLLYKNIRYKISDNRIDIRAGELIVSKIVIPMFRIQHVKTEQTPLYKKFKVASLFIHTAGSIYEIPVLPEEKAEELREKITLLVKRLDDDGL